jgi:hypothetical protein
MTSLRIFSSRPSKEAGKSAARPWELVKPVSQIISRCYITNLENRVKTFLSRLSEKVPAAESRLIYSKMRVLSFASATGFSLARLFAQTLVDKTTIRKKIDILSCGLTL